MRRPPRLTDVSRLGAAIIGSGGGLGPRLGLGLTDAVAMGVGVRRLTIAHPSVFTPHLSPSLPPTLDTERTNPRSPSSASLLVSSPPDPLVLGEFDAAPRPAGMDPLEALVRTSRPTSDPEPDDDAPRPSPEAEVDDAEWEMRVARAMLHLRESLPLLFSEASAKDLFPDDIYSKSVVLRLPNRLPIRVSSLHAYTLAFSIARNGMQALHSNLVAELERMTFPPVGPSSTSASTAIPPSASEPETGTETPSPKPKPTPSALLARGKRSPTSRQRQIRVLLSVHGTPRLPPHKEATWATSSLYTFSPYSGLIASHEVETIRPLPGEGVAEWLMSSLLGFGRRAGDSEGAVPCPSPRAVEVDIEDRPSRA